MEANVCLRLLAQSWRGGSVSKHKLGLVSSPRRHKHEKANNNVSVAGISTQSCLKERSVATDLTPARPSHLPVYTNIELYRQRIALSDVNGDYLYEDLYMRSWDLAKGIIGLLGDNTQTRTRVYKLDQEGLFPLSQWSHSRHRYLGLLDVRPCRRPALPDQRPGQAGAPRDGRPL